MQFNLVYFCDCFENAHETKKILWVIMKQTQRFQKVNLKLSPDTKVKVCLYRTRLGDVCEGRV